MGIFGADTLVRSGTETTIIIINLNFMYDFTIEFDS